MTTQLNDTDQLGRPPDHRHAIRRAPRQPRTWVTEANRGTKKHQKQNDMYICTYNVRTLNNNNLEVMLKELTNVKWNIIGLCETKQKDKQVTIVEGNHYLFNSGNNSTKKNGVGFLIHKSLYEKVADFSPISDRIAYIQLQQKKNKLKIIQCYFPTSDHEDDEIEEMYEQLQNEIDRTPYRDDLVISGDFNAKIGSLHNTHSEAIGIYNTGKANRRGITLADFCVKNELSITNTLFKKRRLTTWTSPSGATKNQIDFILVRQRNKNAAKDCATLSTPDVSDHNLVRLRLKTNIQNFRSPVKPLHQLNLLQNPNIKESYEIELKNKFEKLSEIEEPEEILSTIEKAITSTISEVIPKCTSPKPKWMTENTQKAIENKKRIRNEKGTNSIEYKIIKSEVKKLVKKDKLKQIDDECDELSKLSPNQRYYEVIKKLKNKNPKQFGWGMKRSDGTITFDREEIIQEWEKFYENLYYDSPDNYNVDTNEELKIPPFTIEEIEHAMKQLKCGKAPGVDGIYSEMIKAGGSTITNALHKLFNKILLTNKIPEDFKKAEIVLIYKKGDRKECKNYRPISLLNHTYKTFMLALANRIKNDLYSFLPKSQAAYQPGRTTIEQIISLEQIIEKAIEFNKPVYAVFIDFTKAFDSVKLPSLWSALEKTTINKRYIQLLRNTYSGSKSKIRTNLGTSQYIDILKGVKQGDILSAILFCVLLAAILNNIEDSSGYNIGGQLISNLGYADDIAALDEDPKRLQKYLDEFCNEAEKTGLKINIDKTNALTTAQDQPSITINNRNIEYVENFTYLGHNINNKNNHQIAVDSRITKGWMAVNKNKILLTSPRIPLPTKVNIYQTYILPVVLYGCECITWSNTLFHHIEVFQNKIMRMMTGVKLSDRITIKSLRERTKLASIETEIKKRKIRLFGHLKRQKSGVVKICIEGMVNGKRKQGRPQRRWRDDIKQWINRSWTDINAMTKDRKKWRELGKSQSAPGGGSGP